MNTVLSDHEILDGLKKRDERITRTYFYNYCKIAYCIYDKRYGLRNMPGMDFFSLAHEYYLSLSMRDFKQLEDKKPSMSLKTWMVNGFRFVLLDKMKAVSKEHLTESFEERVDNSSVRFDVVDNNYKEECHKLIRDLCSVFGRDDTNSIILEMLFVEGFKSKEIAAQLGMTPSAISQRYQKLMHNYVIPYFTHYYESGEGQMAEPGDMALEKTCSVSPHSDYSIPNTPMEQNRITPSRIDSLKENEVFVFGSNLQGMHGGGAARTARLYFGAVMGKGVGLQGQSYAIPTMQGGVGTIRPYVNDFIAFAQAHPQLHFLVTRIGCGIAGFTPENIAPLFAAAQELPNVSLPLDFWEIIR